MSCSAAKEEVLQAVSKMVATITAMAKLPHHHVLKYRLSIATPLATVVAIAVATNSDYDLKLRKV